MNRRERIGIIERIIHDLEMASTYLVVALIVAFCGWLVMGVGR